MEWCVYDRSFQVGLSVFGNVPFLAIGLTADGSGGVKLGETCKGDMLHGIS